MQPQIAKFMGPTWGPPWSCRPQMGPMSAPWTLLWGTLFSIWVRGHQNGILWSISCVMMMACGHCARKQDDEAKHPMSFWKKIIQAVSIKTTYVNHICVNPSSFKWSANELDPQYVLEITLLVLLPLPPCNDELIYYSGVVISAMVSQINSASIACSTIVQAHIKENIKAPRRCPLWGDTTGHRWMPLTKGLKRGKWFHLMTS